MSTEDEETYEYIFGFGSIMNTSTHATWQNADGKSVLLPGAVATLKKSFGCKREWNFRSSTGFTALGVSQFAHDESCDINGVVFQVPKSEIPNFDRREVGYKKVEVPLEFLDFQTGTAGFHQQAIFSFGNNDKIWLYVPLPSHAMYADENHPLLQSYVDTVLQGALEWGGETMANEFINTTGGWSTYFLNDTPSSRRPWLYRKEYNTIDSLLKKHAEKTHYGDRRHPEEFASAFHQRMKGTWSLPRRNPNFTGRESELDQLLSRLSAQDRKKQRVVVKLEVAGLGGVGKSQLVTEFCYRHFPREYGLVVWLNAESADSLVTDYRQLLADLAAEADVDADIDKSTDEIIGEVKTRLFRSQVPWLLVFDNLEDHDLLENFVPRGAGLKGHVLITTRHVHVGIHSGDENNESLILGCLDTSESLELLRRSAGAHNMEGSENVVSAETLCEKLGNLPLALGMAAAYMHRCDVQCTEYLERYSKHGQSLLGSGKLQDYSLSVAASLSISLREIEKESKTALVILRLLCFLGPDLITKPLFRNLLNAKKRLDDQKMQNKREKQIMNRAVACALLSGAALMMPFMLKQKGGRYTILSITATSLFALSVFATNDMDLFDSADSTLERSPSEPTSFSAYEYEQSDVAWDLLKSFSLLSVREGKGSMHRLLSQALRTSQSEEEARYNLSICVDAMQSMWKFEPGKIETWKDSLQILEHVKSIVSHALEFGADSRLNLRVGNLSKEAGVLSAMALNAFVESKASLSYSLKFFERDRLRNKSSFQVARADSLLELGRLLRYQGTYTESEQSLQDSLKIYERFSFNQGIAETLHELGVLEVKKHNLDSAASFLQKSLEMRKSSDSAHSDDTTNAKCAATLHQLAALHVAKKPPSLEKAFDLLQEALRLSRHIGQRAATLKQLARVTIRQGYLNRADRYLKQSLELYRELYGDNRMHINVAAVKFQQGALSQQQEQFDDASYHFNECLRIRRHVYAYARPLGSKTKDTNPIHLEVSCVLHEMGCVSFAQKRFAHSLEMFQSESSILEKLEETTHQSERLYQAKLTNLTWLRKCAKEMGDEDEASRLSNEKSLMKKRNRKKSKENENNLNTGSFLLQQNAVKCRLLARKFALEKVGGSSISQEELSSDLDRLCEEIQEAPPTPMKQAAIKFSETVRHWMEKPAMDRSRPILDACDELRDVLRAHGVKVTDLTSSKKK